MKYIKIPDDVVLRDPQTGDEVRTISFKEWMKATVLADAYWGKSASKVMAASDLMRRVQDEEDVLTLSDAEYQDVRNVVESPSSGYNVPVAVQVVSFIESVLQPSSDNISSVRAAK